MSPIEASEGMALKPGIVLSLYCEVVLSDIGGDAAEARGERSGGRHWQGWINVEGILGHSLRAWQTSGCRPASRKTE